jgi:hypothetical protein
MVWLLKEEHPFVKKSKIEPDCAGVVDTVIGIHEARAERRDPERAEVERTLRLTTEAAIYLMDCQLPHLAVPCAWAVWSLLTPFDVIYYQQPYWGCSRAWSKALETADFEKMAGRLAQYICPDYSVEQAAA